MSELPKLPNGYSWRLLPEEDITVIPDIGMTNVRLYMGGGLIGPDPEGKPYEMVADVWKRSPLGHDEHFHVFGHTQEELYAKAVEKIGQAR